MNYTVDHIQNLVFRGQTVLMAVVENDDYHIKFRLAENPWGRENNRKTRMYVSGEIETSYDHLPAGWPWDSSPEVVAECRRLNRLEINNQRAVVSAACDALQHEPLVKLLAATKYTFSKTAGCSCGCSPGYILAEGINAVTPAGMLRRVSDIWVTKKS